MAQIEEQHFRKLVVDYCRANIVLPVVISDPMDGPKCKGPCTFGGFQHHETSHPPECSCTSKYSRITVWIRFCRVALCSAISLVISTYLECTALVLGQQAREYYQSKGTRKRCELSADSAYPASTPQHSLEHVSNTGNSVLLICYEKSVISDPRRQTAMDTNRPPASHERIQNVVHREQVIVRSRSSLLAEGKRLRPVRNKPASN